MGCPIDWVDFDDSGYIDPQEMVKCFRKDTKAVVMNQASNVIGTVQDVATVGKECRERGITFILDASQSAGMVPVKMDELCADIICFTGHKSLMGPMGIGGMYVREGTEIRHTRAGGTGVKSIQRNHLDEYPYRMEYGTPNLSGIAGLNAGIKWVDKHGIEAIHKHEMALWKILRDGMAEIADVIRYCAKDVPGRERISVLPFNIDGMEAINAGTMLDVDHDIACRTGLHCTPMVHEHLGTDKIQGAARFGIGPFNNEEQIKTVIGAVSEIAEAQRKRRK
jgi:selenocysteine lyase/cysteine desulfurase